MWSVKEVSSNLKEILKISFLFNEWTDFLISPSKGQILYKPHFEIPKTSSFNYLQLEYYKKCVHVIMPRGKKDDLEVVT